MGSLNTEATLEMYERLKDIDDPEVFEEERKRIIGEFIEFIENPDKRIMLEGLQFSVDREREKVKDPFVCASRVFGIMLERGLFRLDGAWKGELQKRKNNIIPFPKK